MNKHIVKHVVNLCCMHKHSLTHLKSDFCIHISRNHFDPLYSAFTTCRNSLPKVKCSEVFHTHYMPNSVNFRVYPHVKLCRYCACVCVCVCVCARVRACVCDWWVGQCFIFWCPVPVLVQTNIQAYLEIYRGKYQYNAFWVEHIPGWRCDAFRGHAHTRYQQVPYSGTGIHSHTCVW